MMLLFIKAENKEDKTCVCKGKILKNKDPTKLRTAWVLHHNPITIEQGCDVFSSLHKEKHQFDSLVKESCRRQESLQLCLKKTQLDCNYSSSCFLSPIIQT